MAQTRYFNWKDDDKTDWLNRRLIGILPYGLYRGYDAVLASGLNLSLEHNITGFDEVTKLLVHRTNLGLVKTKQGTLVIEDDPVVVPITANPSVEPRIDLVVMEHEYIEVAGGQPAIYKVLVGTPAPVPVAPALSDPNKQVILGELYCPAGMSDLTDTGVVYTKAGIPFFAGDPTVMRTNQNQHSTGDKKFDYLLLGDTMIANISGNSVDFQNQKRNTFVALASPTSAFYVQISNFINLPSQGQGYVFKVLFTQKAALSQSGNISFPAAYGNTLYVEDGEVVEIWDLNNLAGVSPAVPQYYVTKGGEARKHDDNKFRKTVALNKGADISVSGTVHLNTVREGNLFEVTFDTGSTLDSIVNHNPADFFLFTPPVGFGGTPLWIKVLTNPIGGTVTVKHNGGSLPLGYKPILTPTGTDLTVYHGDTLFLIEHQDRYEIVSVIGSSLNLWTISNTITSFIASQQDEAWKFLGDGGTMANGQPIPSLVLPNASSSQPQRLRKLRNGSVEVEGVCDMVGFDTTVSNNFVVMTLPLGYRPAQNKVYHGHVVRSTGIGAAQHYFAEISVLTTGDIEVYVYDAVTPAIAAGTGHFSYHIIINIT